MNQEQKAGRSNLGHKYRWPCSSNYDNNVLLHAFKILQIVVTVKCFVTKTNIDIVLFPLILW